MIESEYIKNLQLQIHYLEMESKYLWKRALEQDDSRKMDEDRNFDDQSYLRNKAIGSSWDKRESTYTNKATRESPRTYSSLKPEDYGKYKSDIPKSPVYDKPSVHDRSSALKSTSYKSMYGTPGKYDTSFTKTVDHTSRGYTSPTYTSRAYSSRDYTSRGYTSRGITSDYNQCDSDINDDLERLIKNVKCQDANLKRLSTEKAKIDEMLNQEKQMHAKNLRKAQDDLERLRRELDNERQQKRQCELEINRLTDDVRENENNLRQLQMDKSMLANQMAQRDHQLQSVKANFEDTRSGLQRRETEMNELQDKYDKSHDIFNQMASEMREEQKALKEHLSSADIKIQELESNRDVLAEKNGQLIKENSFLDQEVNKLQNQLQHERGVLAEKEKQREMAADKISSMANDIKAIRKELQESKQKVSELDSKLQETMENLYAQESQNERLDKMLTSATSRVSELESIRERLSADIKELQDERSSLLDRTSLLESELCYQRGEVEQLQSKAQNLNSQLKDVEELKSLQNSLQMQKWGEFGKLANSMQNLSRSMCQNRGTTLIIETE